MSPAPESPRPQVLYGVLWNSTFQVFQILVSFCAMLVLVRIIPPSEYGRANAVVGILVLVNTFNGSVFMRHALQLPAGVEPDWALHFSAGLYVQVVLALVCEGIAGVFWLLPQYVSIAPLMHVAGVGVLLDAGNQLAIIRLRREMNFLRLRVVQSVALVLSTTVSLAIGFAGWGAYAIVVANNVLLGLPFGVDLFLIRRWRPSAGWWRLPSWEQYRSAFKFGIQQIGSGAVWGGRSALEAATIPALLGFGALGLWGRAQALYTTSLGRLYSVLIETVYPLLPRYAADQQAYARKATLFAQVMVWLILPGALFLGVEGSEVSSLLYGGKWVAAAPLIWPGAMAGLGLSIFTVFSTILLAANRLRASLTMDCICGALGLPAIAFLWFRCSLPVYAWMVALGMSLSACVAVYTARPHISAGGMRAIFAPPASAGLAGLVVLELLPPWPNVPAGRLPLSFLVFAVTVLLVLRIAFGCAMRDLLAIMPAGTRCMRLLRLIPAPISNADTMVVSPTHIGNG